MIFRNGHLVDGRFEILELLGVGGMGQVYKAKQIDLNRLVALKVLDNELVNNLEEWGVRFKREAQTLSQMRHENIATCYSYGMIEQKKDELAIPYLCMELIEGSSLANLLAAGEQFNQEQAVEIALQIAEGMEYVHLHHIIHRDLKLENILLETSPANNLVSVKIIDFGLSRSSVEGVDTLTDTGALIGSPLSMSPEQCMGKRADKRSDTYALGCILYTLVTGKPPFDADNAIAVFHKHISEEPPLPKSINNTPLLKGLSQVILKSLDKDADDRFQSMSEFARDLALVKGDQSNLLRIKLRSNAAKKQSSPFMLALISCLVIISTGLVFNTFKQHSQKSAVNVNLQNKTVATTATKSKRHKFLEYMRGSEDSVETANNLLRLSESGEYSISECEQLTRKALGIQKQILGPKDQSVCHTLLALAQICYSKGDLNQAQELLLQALKIAEQKDQDPLVHFTLLSKVGKFMSLFGQMPELALPLIEKSVAIAKKTSGELDPYLPDVLPELANLYWRSGQKNKAKTALEESIALRQKAPIPLTDIVGNLTEHNYDKPSIFIAYDYVSLAGFYQEEGNYKKAEELLKKSIQRREQEKNTAAITEGYYRLAMLYSEMGNLNKAEAALANRLNLDSDFADIILFFPRIYEKKKGLDKAIQFYYSILSHYSKHPRGDIREETILSRIADLYEEKGDYKRAEDALDQAISELQRKAAAAERQEFPAPSLITIKTELAGALERKGKTKEAANTWSQILKIEDLLHAGPRDKLIALQNLARFAVESNDAAAEKMYKKKALSIFKKASKYDFLDDPTEWRFKERLSSGKKNSHCHFQKSTSPGIPNSGAGEVDF